MEIDKAQANQVRLPVRGPDPAQEVARGVAPRNRVGKAHQDSLSLSEEAQELRSALKAVQSAPDVRVDRVEELRRRIADGTYSVSSSSLARDILNALGPGAFGER